MGALWRLSYREAVVDPERGMALAEELTGEADELRASLGTFERLGSVQEADRRGSC